MALSPYILSYSIYTPYTLLSPVYQAHIKDVGILCKAAKTTQCKNI